MFCDLCHFFVLLELALVYIKGCYKYKQYEKCVGEIDKYLPFVREDKVLQELKSIKGKALFQEYTKEKSCLANNASSMPPNRFFTAHSACFSKLKDIITVIGDVLDHSQLDSEGSRMLDLAMMDCICETNKLYESHRCYLCRDNLATNVTSSDAKSAGKKGKLANSHMFPKSILNRFASAVPLPKSKKIFDNLIPGLGRLFDKEQPASAKECTVFMLCHTCEDTLSKHGENWFVTNFFDKLYDTDDPSKSRSEQSIQYNHQLYMFSLGIIFRALYWNWNKFINSEELSQLLMKCRSCLLSPELLPKIEKKPDVYLLMSPLSADKKDLKYGFMNQVLTSTCNLRVGSIDLGTGVLLPKDSLNAHFVLVHIGMVNFLVKLSPSTAVDVPSQYLINPTGGLYFVPAEEKRRAILPRGIWAAFEFMAKEFEASWYEHLNKPGLMCERQEKILPEDSAADTYGIITGLVQEMMMLNAPEPSQNPDQPKIVNFLPELFHVHSRHIPGDVILPEGHRILLHHTFKQEAQATTIFLAVGETQKFSLEKLYVLWHNFKPGFQKNFGFFISTDDLSGTQLLMGTKEKFFAVNPDPEVKETMKTIAPVRLKELLFIKGFYSIKSLLYRVQALR